MNTCSFVGRIGRIEGKTSAAGKAVTKFSVAVQRSKEEVVWVNAVAFGSSAEFISKYFEKGDVIGITSEYTENAYTDKEGVQKKSAEFVVRQAFFVPRPPANDREVPAEESPANMPF